MYNVKYCELVRKIKASATDIIIYRNAYQPEKLLQLFLEESRRCYYTLMSFPSSVVSVREQQAQRQNYDYFIHTMAEMMKKYAPEILK